MWYARPKAPVEVNRHATSFVIAIASSLWGAKLQRQQSIRRSTLLTATRFRDLERGTWSWWVAKDKDFGLKSNRIASH
jgi:hypothetical protein